MPELDGLKDNATDALLAPSPDGLVVDLLASTTWQELWDFVEGDELIDRGVDESRHVHELALF